VLLFGKGPRARALAAYTGLAGWMESVGRWLLAKTGLAEKVKRTWRRKLRHDAGGSAS